MGISRNPLQLTGRFDFLFFYRLGNKIVFRMAKPHTRKRILKDPCFKKFRECSGIMARASKIGSVVYRALPVEFRQYWMYKAFVGEAIDMLKNKGMKAENVLEALWKTYVEVWEIKKMMNEEVIRNNDLKQQRSPEIVRQPVKIKIDWKPQIELPVFGADYFSCMRKGIHGARAPAEWRSSTLVDAAFLFGR